MKRLILILLVCLVALGAYAVYSGQAETLLRRAKQLASPGRPKARAVPATTNQGKSGLRAAVFRYDQIAAKLSAPDSYSRIAAWEELSKVYLNGSKAERLQVLPALRGFVSKYILSSRFPSDPREAARVNVKQGDSLARIAKQYGTTVEGIMRLNKLQSPIIRPGMTLKVLNQPIAIFVKKSEYRLWVTYGGKFLLEAPCGIGKENRTPSGTFVIEDRIKDPEWYRPDGKVLPPGDPENELGSRWLGFKDTDQYSGLGMHEARNPSDVGKPSSNGCLRLLKDDIQLLFDITPRGTTVTIYD